MEPLSSTSYTRMSLKDEDGNKEDDKRRREGGEEEEEEEMTEGELMGKIQEDEQIEEGERGGGGEGKEGEKSSLPIRGGPSFVIHRKVVLDVVFVHELRVTLDSWFSSLYHLSSGIIGKSHNYGDQIQDFCA
ncbi:hypothetical protein STEG23_021250, partial [Scotinomys teguina]